jgi:hypothetical protein
VAALPTLNLMSISSMSHSEQPFRNTTIWWVAAADHHPTGDEISIVAFFIACDKSSLCHPDNGIALVSVMI